MIRLRNKKISMLLVLTFLVGMFASAGTVSAADWVDVESNWTFVQTDAANQVAGDITINPGDGFDATLLGPDNISVVVTLNTAGVAFSGTGSNKWEKLSGNALPMTLYGNDELMLDIDGEVTGAITVDVRVYGKNGTAYIFDETETQVIARFAGPDLVFSSIAGPTIGAANSKISLTDTVKNQGNIKAGSFYVRYYLEADAETSSDIYLGQRYVSSLAAGASSSAASSMLIPAGIANGDYYIKAIADATNVIVESDETNNSEYATDMITITTPYTDLVVQSITGPTAGAANSRISITNSVENQGNKKTGAFNIKYYLSADNDITSSDIYLGQRDVSSLAAGASSSTTSSLLIPAGVANGDYYIGAIADATNRVTESAETNNTGYTASQISITAPYPDLIVQRVAGPTAGAANSKISITNSVKNQGNKKAGAFYIKYYLSADNDITSSDIYLGQRYVSSLAAGASISTTNNLLIPASVTHGDYYIGAIADVNNAIKESDETNNTGYAASQISI